MKKLIAFLAVAIFLIGCAPEAVKAQATVYPLTSPNVSITAGATSYLSVLPLTQTYNTVAIQANVTKLSGTPNGFAYLQGSNDGTNYKTISAASTFTLTDVATQNFIWVLETNPYYYYRIASVGSATVQCSSQAGWFMPKR